MPYKIYTYADPYSIGKADFWDTIRNLPHFCVSRTLVNGLKDVMKDSIGGLLCQLDDFINHKEVYQDWTKNISLRLRQYTYLTKCFRKSLSQGKIDAQFFSSLQQNQNHFLNALRLFIELNIPADSLHCESANREQRLFIEVLQQIQANNEDLFRFPKTPGLDSIKRIINELAQKELDDFNALKGRREDEFQKKERVWFDRSIVNTAEQPLNTIIIHGVHQFSPAQLRLIIDLEKMGLTIIFLHNYQPQFSEIYSSWKYIYRYFEAPAHHDTHVPEFQSKVLQNESNALGTALGDLCEGRFEKTDTRSGYETYRGCELREFGNVTEYATFISNHFELALQKYYEQQPVQERAGKTKDTSAILRLVEEQVYTANREVHNLLKVYYPEFSRDRHFLSYPIGQFFTAIYRLWNWETHEINFELPAIKECLSSGILRSGVAEKLLRTVCHMELLLEGISGYSLFRDFFEKKYISLYDEVTSVVADDTIKPLRMLSIYNPYKIRKEDIQNLAKAVQEINEIARFLFDNGDYRQDYINFGQHFENLEAFIRQRQPDLINEEEDALISALMTRFDHVKKTTGFEGTFRDLRQGLTFYLKQKDDEEHVDWIVKNFEQIDGDILLSKRQYNRGESKVYHFACVSDRDLSCPIDNLLPWPLTDTFIRKAYSPVDMQFQVYYAALGERSHFLRYALFYGLFYNWGKVRLSYVKKYGEETTEPYVLLKVLGIKPVPLPEEAVSDSIGLQVRLNGTDIGCINTDRFQLMDMFLCPYRFFNDYILNDSPVLEGAFLYQKLFENLLIENVWRKIEKKPREIALENLQTTVRAEAKRLWKYCLFWRSTEVEDLVRRAFNYISFKIIPENGSVKSYSPTHLKIRKLYGKAQFFVDVSEDEHISPYLEFEKLCRQQTGNIKEYSLHRIRDGEAMKPLIKDTMAYINEKSGEGKIFNVGDWCQYCANRSTCLEPYLLGK